MNRRFWLPITAVIDGNEGTETLNSDTFQTKIDLFIPDFITRCTFIFTTITTFRFSNIALRAAFSCILQLTRHGDLSSLVKERAVVREQKNELDMHRFVFLYSFIDLRNKVQAKRHLPVWLRSLNTDCTYTSMTQIISA